MARKKCDVLRCRSIVKRKRDSPFLPVVFLQNWSQQQPGEGGRDEPYHRHVVSREANDFPDAVLGPVLLATRDSLVAENNGALRLEARPSEAPRVLTAV